MNQLAPAEGVSLIWEGGEHRFFLPIRYLRALQDKCDAGPAHILGRLADNTWYVDDIVETIRLALQGGGLDESEARSLVRKHVEGRPLMQSITLAQGILASALIGAEDDPVGELDGETPTREESASPEERSSGVPSMDLA